MLLSVTMGVMSMSVTSNCWNLEVYSYRLIWFFYHARTISNFIFVICTPFKVE